ncbi:MAG: 30S ribosomal protein S11 [Pelagibacterales bacterium]|nr:30S ribosomal protein S11 [Pelagibacterales bacterium]
MYLHRIKKYNLRTKEKYIYNYFKNNIDKNILSVKTIHKLINESNKFKISKTYLLSNIINIKITNTNIIFALSNNKNKIIKKLSSGDLGFKGSQKTKKFALISILKTFVRTLNLYNNKPVSIHFKGIKRYQKLVIKKLKEKFFIYAVKHNNINPHNGCRPKKIKRK